MLRKLEHLRIVTGFCGDTFSPYSNPPSLPRGLASRPPGGAQMSSEGHKQAARRVPGGYQGPPWADYYQGQACEAVLSHLFHGPPLSSFPLGQPACQTVCRKADKRTTRQSFCYRTSCGHGLKIACHRQPTPHSRRRGVPTPQEQGGEASSICNEAVVTGRRYTISRPPAHIPPGPCPIAGLP